LTQVAAATDSSGPGSQKNYGPPQVVAWFLEGQGGTRAGKKNEGKYFLLFLSPLTEKTSKNAIKKTSGKKKKCGSIFWLKQIDITSLLKSFSWCF
jgi:hypothetical protein